MIVCLSGRGDKDVVQVRDRLNKREESKMGKTLTEHLQSWKTSSKGSLFLILWQEIMKKAWQVCRKPSNFWRSFGVSAIEVGIPFSDPVADGPVIEEAWDYEV